MKSKFTAVLALALALSMFTTGYCESIQNKEIIISPGVKPQTQVKVVPRVIKPNVSTAPKATAPQGQTTAPKPTVSPKPTTQAPKPAPKPVGPGKSFLGKQPVPVKYMQAPNPQSFQPIVKKDYHLSLPSNFGSDPLANLPGTDGPMLVRFKDDVLFMAVNVIDPTDTTSFNANQALPQFDQKTQIVKWFFGPQGQLECLASEYKGFYGDAIVIEGKQVASGKTYELLFSFPKAQAFEYLPTVMYALNSFKPT